MASKPERNSQIKELVQEIHSETDNFNLNTILRGAQLTVVGAVRALHNPYLFRSEIYRQAFIAVMSGVCIRVVMEIPIFFIKFLIWTVSTFASIDETWWDEHVAHGLNFMNRTILQLPYLLMNLLRLFLIEPHLDDMFMTSLDWVDRTYRLKHQAKGSEDPRGTYFDHLKQYPIRTRTTTNQKGSSLSAKKFLIKFGTRSALSLLAYTLSFLPAVGRFVLPTANFITFRNSIGLVPASVIFATGLILPRNYLTAFLQIYHGSRTLMRELMEPYLRRIQFSEEQQRKFFREREGVCFGFGIGFYLLLKIPFLGVMIYGIAEASTAYLITKITEPPPPPNGREVYAQSQTKWTNKKDFVKISLFEFETGGSTGMSMHLDAGQRENKAKISKATYYT